MGLSFPVSRYIQSTAKTEAPKRRFGSAQWVLSRALYRFQAFDLSQVPAKSRAQALNLELKQWSPFGQSDYYVGWHGARALVWAWDAQKVRPALSAQRLKPQRAQILPESVLHAPVAQGLCLDGCVEGFEGQFWRERQLLHSRWWPQLPSAEEWLMFQRDAGVTPDAQQSATPKPRNLPLLAQPWLEENALASGGTQVERLALAAAVLALAVPTLWYGVSLFKLQQQSTRLNAERAKLQSSADPIMQARSQALEHLARINALRALYAQPNQLALMGQVAQTLPPDRSSLKDWEYQAGQLKFTLASSNDISASFLIGALQQAGPFRNVKALPGRDPKSVTFQMEVLNP